MGEDRELALDVKDLEAEYRQGRTSTKALKGVTFQVAPGETVGFIGPNGAGKTTTIKSLLGFIFPTAGSVSVFGQPAGAVESRRRLGYLPEVALYYPFMKARELLQLYGGLHGMSAQELKACIPGLLAKVGLPEKGETLLRNFSKGMQQRLGIAQAIIADPELLIFDELSSGLDPAGRHDLRQVLLELKERGRTIFFSSHELTEVEALCDRVIIINQGELIAQSPVSELLRPLNRFQVEFTLPDGRSLDEVNSPGASFEKLDGGAYRCELAGSDAYAELIRQLAELQAPILHTKSHSLSLEEYFMKLIRPNGAQ